MLKLFNELFSEPFSLTQLVNPKKWKPSINSEQFVWVVGPWIQVCGTGMGVGEDGVVQRGDVGRQDCESQY
jgi:hypothetical protein